MGPNAFVFNFNMHKFLHIFAYLNILLIAAHGESLWLKSRNSETGLYASQTASRIGDVLLVKVSETLNSNQKLKMTTDKKPNSGSNNTLAKFITDKFVDLFGKKGDSLKSVDGTQKYENKAEIGDTRNLTHDFSTTVIDVLPNGMLVIEGSRVVSYAGEQWFSVIRGMVRPADIRADNSVDSNRIADARIDILPKGTISDPAGKGWLTHAVEALTPY